jgi:hypothetical protein
MTDPSVNFVLSAFDSEIQLDVCGNLVVGEAPESIDASAVAVIEVSLQAFKDIFKFQTDAKDVTNAAETDIRYIVDKSVWESDVSRNPVDATLDHASGLTSGAIALSGQKGSYAADKKFVCHDFIRHIASHLFNTHHGVDLFTNEDELLLSVRQQSLDVAYAAILDVLAAVDVNNTTLDSSFTDLSDNVYYAKTDSDTSANNIGRVLFRQMINQQPARFDTIEDTDLPQSLPFVENDTVSFKLTIKAAEGQHLLTQKVDEVPERSYRIKYLLKASPSNTALASDELPVVVAE